MASRLPHRSWLARCSALLEIERSIYLAHGPGLNVSQIRKICLDPSWPNYPRKKIKIRKFGPVLSVATSGLFRILSELWEIILSSGVYKPCLDRSIKIVVYLGTDWTTFFLLCVSPYSVKKLRTVKCLASIEVKTVYTVCDVSFSVKYVIQVALVRQNQAVLYFTIRLN